MTSPVLAILVVAVVAAIVVAAIVRSRRSNDGVDSFRRQIDALSPEARRPVVDQVQTAAERQTPRGDAGDDDSDDEDDARGT